MSDIVPVNQSSVPTQDKSKTEDRFKNTKKKQDNNTLNDLMKDGKSMSGITLLLYMIAMALIKKKEEDLIRKMAMERQMKEELEKREREKNNNNNSNNSNNNSNNNKSSFMDKLKTVGKVVAGAAMTKTGYDHFVEKGQDLLRQDALNFHRKEIDKNPLANLDESLDKFLDNDKMGKNLSKDERDKFKKEVDKKGEEQFSYISNEMKSEIIKSGYLQGKILPVDTFEKYARKNGGSITEDELGQKYSKYMRLQIGNEYVTGTNSKDYQKKDMEIKGAEIKNDYKKDLEERMDAEVSNSNDRNRKANKDIDNENENENENSINISNQLAMKR